MRVIERLLIQKALGSLVLFREGLFLKAYNESAYILTCLLGQDLRVKYYRDGGLLAPGFVMCKFRYSCLRKRLPNSTVTLFGAIQSDNFDLFGYESWYGRRCRTSNEVRCPVIAEELSLKTAISEASSAR